MQYALFLKADVSKLTHIVFWITIKGIWCPPRFPHAWMARMREYHVLKFKMVKLIVNYRVSLLLWGNSHSFYLVTIPIQWFKKYSRMVGWHMHTHAPTIHSSLLRMQFAFLGSPCVLAHYPNCKVLIQAQCQNWMCKAEGASATTTLLHNTHENTFHMKCWTYSNKIKL